VKLEIDVRESPGQVYTVDLAGEVDIYSSSRITDAITELIDRERYNIVINCEKVRYIDSTGLGALIGGVRRVREHGGAINVVCTDPHIYSIFDVTGLVKVFGMFDDEQRATEALREYPAVSR